MRRISKPRLLLCTGEHCRRPRRGAGRLRPPAPRCRSGYCYDPRAIALGFINASLFRNDPDLDSLRSRPDFQALMMDVVFPSDPFARGR